MIADIFRYNMTEEELEIVINHLIDSNERENK